MGDEQRKYVRFLAQDMAFAALRSGFKKVGRIQDISLGGLGFSYLSENIETNSVPHQSQVDIFISGNGFHLSNVPCRIIYDIPYSDRDKGLMVKVSRCGLQFVELTAAQLDQLNFFIKHYTRGILKPSTVIDS